LLLGISILSTYTNAYATDVCWYLNASGSLGWTCVTNMTRTINVTNNNNFTTINNITTINNFTTINNITNNITIYNGTTTNVTYNITVYNGTNTNVTYNITNNYTTNETKYIVNFTVVDTGTVTHTICLFNGTCYQTSFSDSTGSNNYPTSVDLTTTTTNLSIDIARNGLSSITDSVDLSTTYLLLTLYSADNSSVWSRLNTLSSLITNLQLNITNLNTSLTAKDNSLASNISVLQTDNLTKGNLITNLQLNITNLNTSLTTALANKSNIFSLNCGVGNYVQQFNLSNQSVICAVDQTSVGGGGFSSNQNVNTTANVTFNNVSVSNGLLLTNNNTIYADKSIRLNYTGTTGELNLTSEGDSMSLNMFSMNDGGGNQGGTFKFVSSGWGNIAMYFGLNIITIENNLFKFKIDQPAGVLFEDANGGRDWLIVNKTDTISYNNITASPGNYFEGDGSHLTGVGGETVYKNYTKVDYGTINNTVYTGLNGLSINLPANKNYSVYCNLWTSSAAATTGEQLQINFTNTPKINLTYDTAVSATTRTPFSANGIVGGYTFADTGSGGTNVMSQSIFGGVIETGASATLVTYSLKSEIVSSYVTVRRLSWCQYTVIT
jgi:hypothetical protein